MGVAELLEEGEIYETEECFCDEQSIDDRIERVLGNFRKGFEGLVSEETLGPMFGGYGTFLIDPKQQQSSSSVKTWSGNPSGFQNTRRFGAQQKPGSCQVKGMGLEKSSCQVVSLNKLRQDIVGMKQESLYYMDKENIPSNVNNSQVRKAAEILGRRSPSEHIRKIAKSEAKESRLDGRSSGIGRKDKKETNVVEDQIKLHTTSSSMKRSCHDRLEDISSNLISERNKRQRLSNKTVHIKDSSTTDSAVSVRKTTTSGGGCSKKVTILRVPQETFRHDPKSTCLVSTLLKEAKVVKKTLKDTSRHESTIGQIKDSATDSTVTTSGCSKKVTILLRVPEQTVPASTSPVSSLLKEAEVVNNCANSLKDTSRHESNVLFLEAAMKFLSGGSLIEQGNRETTRYGKSNAMKVYHSAASLSQYCAHEFESCGKMALAALAYKCAEVTFMRMIYSAQGENHSSPASCVDNNLGDASNDFPKYVKLVELAKDVNCAMEASRKSRQAFAAAASAAGNVLVSGNAVDLIKSAINFSFHDVGQFILRVHQAMEELQP